ncbi:MAG: hypothetical protein JO027_14840 [Solirubrobacterales bacterium]|nr:hypothetical protein [Solirubrobacterales bacterium]
MSATQTPAPSAAPDRAAGQSGRDDWRELLQRYPFVSATVACVVLAALSAALLPTVASYDPWAWISWGREVVDPHLSFAISGGPSWKPLPVLFTTAFALFGSTAAPTLWVITARAGGLLALFAAYRLGARLVGSHSPRWAAVTAGVLAAAGVVVTQEWFYEMFRGTSEPMLIACALWAIDRHLERRYGWAFVLGVATSLIRPEAWPLIILYAAWLWWRSASTRTRALIVLGLLAIPFFWFVPPWIGSGQPFLAAVHAEEYNGQLGSDPFLTVLGRGLDVQTIPILILGAVAVTVAWLRRPRDWLTLALGAGALVWWVVVVGMTLDGYPGLERFYLPAAGVTAVLAGVGIVRLAELAARGRGLVAAGVIVALVALTIPFTGGRLGQARAQERIAAQAVTRLDQMKAAVAAVGGHSRVFPCKSSFAAVNHGVQTALAWQLHVTLGRVGTSMRHQGVMFVGPHDTIDGIAAPVKADLTSRQLLARVGVWRVYRVTRPGSDTRCVGS